MSADAERKASLEDLPQFQQMPAAMRGWILESPTATSQFAAFFERGGFIDQRLDAGLPYYAPGSPPRIVVDRNAWDALLSPGASTWPQRHMFGTLAHEIGHDRFNTGSVVFAGRTADEYVSYRAGLEANAIFNAFPVFNELEAVAEFKSGKPFGSIGYLNEVELGMLYGDWKAGRLNDAAAVERIATKVADAPYTLNNPPSDINRDGVVTHRDAYLRDYAKYIEPKLQQPSVQNDPRDPQHPDSGLLEHLRGQVRALDRKAGKDWDEGSERLSASAFAMAKEKGYTLADDPQLAFNQPSGRLAAGEVLHLFRQGPNASPDPYANRAHMQTAEAISVPAEERYRQAEAMSAPREEQARVAALGSNGPDKSGPGLAM
ncbi:XVIPCD domain-containing protein [Lysobacter enzymogenes]|uniref:XVIPCD domain-containing protein n=1 Tax=Lysobacter enzymogenes TaxID=69 RepID=UPI00384B0128